MFFFSSRRRHTRLQGDWSSDVCSSDLGEHDASLDRGDAYQQFFGKLNYTFDHKGVHFIVLDNVSDPGAIVGESQIGWLKADLKQQKADARIVVLTHRPLFDLYPDWDWATRDGSSVIRSEEHTSELQSPCNLVCRLLLEKK